MVPEPAGTPRVWVDTDVALGASRGDVDDGFALAALGAAHRRGSIELVGVSTVFGNTNAAISQKCAREIFRRCGVSVDVFVGAERNGGGSQASEALAAAAAEDLDIVALGPLSNLAAACRMDPGLPYRTRLRTVGGNLSSRGFLPPLWPFEFNFARDSDSARFVLRREWRSLALFPLDVVCRLRVGTERLKELARRSALGGYLAQGSARWLSHARWRHFAPRFPLWDLPAALDVLGILGGEYAHRPLAPAARRYTGAQGSLSSLVGFDPEKAWQAFLRLLEDR